MVMGVEPHPVRHRDVTVLCEGGPHEIPWVEGRAMQVATMLAAQMTTALVPRMTHAGSVVDAECTLFHYRFLLEDGAAKHCTVSVMFVPGASQHELTRAAVECGQFNNSYTSAEIEAMETSRG